VLVRRARRRKRLLCTENLGCDDREFVEQGGTFVVRNIRDRKRTAKRVRVGDPDRSLTPNEGLLARSRCGPMTGVLGTWRPLAAEN
jgi:hypothetical protein